LRKKGQRSGRKQAAKKKKPPSSVDVFGGGGGKPKKTSGAGLGSKNRGCAERGEPGKLAHL